MLAPVVVAALIGAGVAVGGAVWGAISGSNERKRQDKFVKNLRENQPPINPSAFQMPQQNQAKFDKMAMDAQNRRAAQMNAATIDKREQAQFRQGQMDLMGQLQDRAAGNAPSAAEMTLRKAQEANLAQARSAAVSAEGVSPAMALKAQLGAQTTTNIEAGQQAAITRAQEQATAIGQLSGLMGQAREQDIGLATTQAGFQQEANVQNLEANMQQRQMNDQMTAFYMQQGFTRDEAQLKANMAQQEMIQQSYLQREAIAAGAKFGGGGGSNTGAALMSGGMSIVGSALGGWLAGGGGK